MYAFQNALFLEHSLSTHNVECSEFFLVVYSYYGMDEVPK